MQTSHPFEERHSRFQRFADAASNFTSRSAFFVAFLVMAFVWAWALFTEHDRLEHGIVGLFTIVTLFKITLLANAEKRDLQTLEHQLEELGVPAEHVKSAP